MHRPFLLSIALVRTLPLRTSPTCLGRRGSTAPFRFCAAFIRLRSWRSRRFWTAQPGAVTLVYLALLQREPMFCLVLLAFSQVTFLKSGSICPAGSADFAGQGKFCRVKNRARQTSPGHIYLARAKSIPNQTLPPSGMALANGHAGKTPKSNARYQGHARTPRTERLTCLLASTPIRAPLSRCST